MFNTETSDSRKILCSKHMSLNKSVYSAYLFGVTTHTIDYMYMYNETNAIWHIQTARNKLASQTDNWKNPA